MGMLTIVLLAVVAVAVVVIIQGEQSKKTRKLRLEAIRSLGLFALVLGMLGQFIGLFTAFELIGGGMDVSPQLMASGVKVSMITTIYGMIIFVISYLLWLSIKLFHNK